MATEASRATATRVRKPNFSQAERAALFAGVCKWRDAVISVNKSENAGAKAQAFEEITSRVNQVSSVVRTVKEVKKKWLECRGFALRLEQTNVPGRNDEVVQQQAKRKDSTERLPEVKLVLQILSGKITPHEVTEWMNVNGVETSECTDVSQPAHSQPHQVVSIKKEVEDPDMCASEAGLTNSLHAENMPAQADLPSDPNACSFDSERDTSMCGNISGTATGTQPITDFKQQVNEAHTEETAASSSVDSHNVQTENLSDFTFSSSSDHGKVPNGTSVCQDQAVVPTPGVGDEFDGDLLTSHVENQPLVLENNGSKFNLKERKLNFSDKEMSLLMDGLEVHRNVLCQRALDDQSAREKLQAWRIITEYVNKNTDQNVRRTAKELRKKMVEMNFRTRNYTRAAAQNGKEATTPPWFYNRMMKLETLRPLYRDKPGRTEPKQMFYKQNRMKRMGILNATSHGHDHLDEVVSAAADHQADSAKQKMIQHHLSRVAESFQELQMYGVEAGALIVHNGRLHSFGSDCRGLLAKSNLGTGDPIKVDTLDSLYCTRPSTLARENNSSTLTDGQAISMRISTSLGVTEGSGAVHRQSIQMNDDADNNADDDGADQLTVTFAAAEGTKGGDGHLAHLTNSAPQGQTHPTGHDPTSGEGLPSQQKKVKQKVRRPCDVCGAKLSSHLSLRRHMECHMGVDRKRFPCEACGAKFTTKESLQHHRRERHTGERPFKCEHCDRSFSHNNYLKLHRKHHTGERFTCEVCGASFLQRQTLTVHVRIHTGENPFSCEECSRKFRRKDSLKSHIIRHHRSERPFNCKVCTRGFVKACKLKEHMRIHTGEAPYACCQCEKRFKRADHLREHMKSRHPIFAANARNGGP